MFLRSTNSFFLLTVLSLIAAAQEKTPEKLKEIATDAMKKANVNDARLIETDSLIVATPLPDAKAKPLAEALQKTCAMAKKGLKFDAADAKEPKTIVYSFTDVDQYRQFSRSVLKMRPEDAEVATFDVKADVPFIAVGPRRGEKAPNLESIAGAEICRALLAKKGGNARLTEWMKDGFARAVALRLNPGSAAADRAAVRRLAPKLAKTAKGMSIV